MWGGQGPYKDCTSIATEDDDDDDNDRDLGMSARPASLSYEL
jgi:hypothetical protein